MPVPNTFATATTSIPLSQLDANFATAITIGNTAVQLGNTITTLNNMTLSNTTISVASNLTVPGNLTVTGDLVPSSSFLRNRIINGAMVIDQRYAGAATANTINGYTLDRWAVNQTVTGKLIAQQSAAVYPAGFSNSLSITSQSAYSVLSSDYYIISQPVEGFNFADMMWGTASAQAVTLSFRVYSSLTGTFGGSLRNSAGNRSYPFSYSIPSANTWTTVSVTIPGDTTGTWVGATNGVGVNVFFSLGAGSTFSSTAGSWASGNYISATGAVSVVGTSGATFYITGVQLEVGSNATPFERRQYGQELMLCQRYYCKTFDQTVAPATNTGNRNGCITFTYTSTGGFRTQCVFPVEMRAAPTLANYNPNAANTQWRDINNGVDYPVIASIAIGTRQTDIGASSSLGGTAVYMVHLTASAEL